MKKILLFIVVLSLFLTGCVPSQYRDGIRVDRDYPKKELPIYDDAVVYESDSHKNEVTVSYGTTDDIDDVIEFYMDFFEDEGIAVEQEESRDEYTAEGRIDDFVFEVEVEEASGKYEEKVFETTVDVEIEFVDETTIAEDTPESILESTPIPQQTQDSTQDTSESNDQLSLLQEMQGFWIAVAIDDEEYEYWDIAIEIFDYTLTNYSGFATADYTVEFECVDSDSISFTEDGKTYIFDIDFVYNDSLIYMTIDDGETAVTFVKSSYDIYQANIPDSDVDSSSGLDDSTYVDYSSDEGYLEVYIPHGEAQSDEDISGFICDGAWKLIYYTPREGLYNYDVIQVYNADGTTTYSSYYEDADGTPYAWDMAETWYVENQMMYETDEEYTWVYSIEVGYDSDYDKYFLFFESLCEVDYGAKYIYEWYMP